MLLRQPNGGRIVEVDDEQEARQLIEHQRFTVVSEEEAETYYAERLQRIQEAHQAAPPENMVDVYFKTAQKRGDGYGMSAYHLKNELAKLGVFLNPEYTGQKIGLLYHRPTGITQFETEVRLIYTMFESTKIPGDWKTYCDFSDLVMVPSRWCQDVFKDCGVDTEVVPLGYNDNTFKFIDRPVPVDENKDFVFLHYNAYNLRKGFREVLLAFEKAFKPTDPVKMIFKTTLDTPPLPLPKSEYPNIEIISGDVPESELQAILGRANCFVFPSRGEGFGITPLEAMATGIPAIVPNAHGISHYFNPACMYKVAIKEMCPGIYHSYKGQDVGEMYVSDIDDLAEKMRYVFHHQHEAKEMGMKAAEYVKQFTYRQTAEKMAEIIFRFQNAPIKKRRDSDILAVEVI